MKKSTLTGKVLIKRLWLIARPFFPPILIIFICIISTTLIDAINSFCLSKIFDMVQNHGTDLTYLNNALLYVGIALILILIRILIVGYQGRTQIRRMDQVFMNHLNHESISKFFSFSNGQHINEHSGVKQTIVNSGTASIQNQIALLTQQLAPYLARCIVGIIGIFYASRFMGGIFLVIALIFFSLMYRLNTLLVPGIRKLRERRQLNSRFISELYRHVTVVKNESQEDNSLSELSFIQEKHHRISMDTWLPSINRLQLIRTVTAVLRYSALGLVVYLVFNKQMTIGDMFLVFTWSAMLIDSLWFLTDIHKQFLLDKINIERYLEMFEVIPDITIVDNPIKLDKINGTIEFKNVSFYYAQRLQSYEVENEDAMQTEPVLRKVSFTIKPGEKIGMVGESGSGKSTIASLIRRSFDPQDGQILIDGNDIRLLELNGLLQKIGNVEQDVTLFDKSIKDNILYGLHKDSEVPSEKRLWEICKFARIDTFFKRLEFGLDTLVGEKGVKLSGGERQRVGIARALSKNPSILIFDEATSALDSISEKKVQAAIDEACKGKTSIVIAHRLSTVKNCHKILVFKQGSLIDQGTHRELLKRCEYYAELAQHQMVEQSTE